MSDPTRPTGSNTKDNEQNKFKDNSLGEVSVKTVSEITNTSINPVPVDFATTPTTPNVRNIVISALDVGTIISIPLVDGTRKLTFQHREGSKVEFGFTPTLTEYFTMYKGAVYSSDNLNTQGLTLYIRVSKEGTIELLEWT